MEYKVYDNQPQPDFPEEAKTPETEVLGCMSTVHMIVREDQDRPDAVDFLATSDALSVNGLIAILMIIYNHKTPDEIRQLDIQGVFQHLGLEGHISPNRRNGFFSMVERLKNLSSQTHT